MIQVFCIMITFKNNFMCSIVCTCTTWVQYPQNPEESIKFHLQTVTYVLRTEPESSRRAVSALKTTEPSL